MISAAVDGELVDDERPLFENHLRICADCRSELELEQVTKAFIRHRLVPVPTPQHAVSQILQRIRAEAKRPASLMERLESWLPLPSWKTALAAGGIVVAVLAFLISFRNFPHSHSQPSDGNILHQTYNNFDGFLKGSLVPTVASENPAEVRSALASNVNFHVCVPRLKGCKLVGGLLTKYNSENIAHVIYHYGNNVVYVYQTNLAAVERGQVLNLPPEAFDELRHKGWYFENHLNNCSLIALLEDSTVCVAMADINRNDLFSCLKTTGDTP